MKWTTTILATALGLTVATVGAAWAAPAMLTYSGHLEGADGSPFNGQVGVIAALYDAADGGNKLWEQDLGSVDVTDGHLRVMLSGGGIDAVVMANEMLWMDFNLDGAPLSPRQMVTSAPFAYEAGDAHRLGGEMPSSFIQTSDQIPAENLPTNGLGQVSNSALNNEFSEVTTTWTGSEEILDFPAPGAIAEVTTVETGDSYLTSLTIYTTFTLDLNSTVQMLLDPPPGSGVPTITLIPGDTEMPADGYGDVWNPTNTPELGDLLGKKVEGTWTLVVTDVTDDGGPGTVVGHLEEFEVVYDVVRSDHIQMAGRFDVSGDTNVWGDTNVTGNASAGSLDIADHLAANGALIREVQYHYTDAGDGCENCQINSRTWTFTKKHDDTDLWLQLHDNFRCINNTCIYRMRLDGADCSNPRNIDCSMQRTSSTNEHQLNTCGGVCFQWGGVKPAAGDHTISLHAVTGGDHHIGWNMGSYFVVQEVWANQK